MGKKKLRKTQTSQGEGNNVSRNIIKNSRREYMKNKFARLCNQIDAFKSGKNVMVTVPNPNTTETNKPFIRVNAKNIWVINNPYMMKQNTAESV